MELNLVLLLEKSKEEQLKFTDALQKTDNAITCIASSNYLEAFSKQQWKIIFVAVNDFPGGELSFIKKHTGRCKSLLVAVADRPADKQVCTGIEADFFLIRPDSVSGWVDTLVKLFAAISRPVNILSPV
ncbi:hypothetical protein ACTHGU_11545 [Chitinophagaceae bacterium MMS25-I14]